MDIAEIRRRIRIVRKRLRELNLDGLVVMGLENVRYLTGFHGHDSWVLVLPRSVTLVTDSRYTEQAQDECVGCRIVQRAGGMIPQIGRMLSNVQRVHLLGVEDNCPVGLYKKLSKTLPVRCKPVGGIVERVRLIKTDDEVKMIRRAGRIAFDAMEWALSQLTPGMTERQLAGLYEYAVSDYNDAAISFETIAAFGPNGSRNHHQPGRRRLRKNDTILLDFGVNYDGYNSDVTRCYAYGKVTPCYRDIYETVARAQKAAIAKVGPGVPVCEVDAAARKVIRQANLPVYGHGTGHGLGMQVHEQPMVTGNDTRTRLTAGQVITIEPGVYLPGKCGIRLEDDVLVTDSGAKVLTRDKRFDVKQDSVPLL